MAKELEKELAEEAGQEVGLFGLEGAGCRHLQAKMKSKFDLPLALGVFVEAPQEELEANQGEKDVEANEAKMEIETNEVKEVQLAESPSELQQNPFKSGWV